MVWIPMLAVVALVDAWLGRHLNVATFSGCDDAAEFGGESMREKTKHGAEC